MPIHWCMCTFSALLQEVETKTCMDVLSRVFLLSARSGHKTCEGVYFYPRGRSEKGHSQSPGCSHWWTLAGWCQQSVQGDADGWWAFIIVLHLYDSLVIVHVGAVHARWRTDPYFPLAFYACHFLLKDIRLSCLWFETCCMTILNVICLFLIV